MTLVEGFLGGSAGRESTRNAVDLGSISGLGRSPGEGRGYPLQYSGLQNSMDCTVHGVARVGHNWATFTVTLSTFMLLQTITKRSPELFSSCITKTLYPLSTKSPAPSFPRPWPPRSGPHFVSINLTTLGTSYKWTQAVFALLWLACFIYRNVFKVHHVLACGQNFLPF